MSQVLNGVHDFYCCFLLNRNAPSVPNSGLPWHASNEGVLKCSTMLAPEIQVPYSIVMSFVFTTTVEILARSLANFHTYKRTDT